MPNQAPPVFSRYGFRRTQDPAAPLEIEPYPAVCANGALRATVIASAIDLVGGFVTRDVAGTDVTFTTDLSLRIPRPCVPARLVAHAETLRSGRRLVTTGVRIAGDDGEYAAGETTFMRLPRRDPVPDPAAIATPDTIPFHPFEGALDAEIGIEPLASGDGVRLPLHPNLLNPEGILQGALVALVTECAALACAETAFDGPAHVTALDLRYLAAASGGPVEGRAEWVGDPAAGMQRVTLRDAARSGPTATAWVHVAPAAGVS